MADAIKKVAGICDIHDYRRSVNTPDFPTADWLINPDLSNVQLPETTDVTTVADVAGNLGGKHFLLDTPSVAYYVWIDVDNTSVDPAPASRVGIEVDITSGATADAVASAIQSAVDAVVGLDASVSTNVVTITNAAVGDVTDTLDVDTGFTIAVTQQGIDVTRIYWKVVDIGGSVFEVQEKTSGEKTSTDDCLFQAQTIIGQLQDINTDTSGPYNFIEDVTRGKKKLSTNEYLLEFSKAAVGDQDWVAPQGRLDSLAAYTCPYDATVVASSTHVVDTGSSTFELRVYINGVDSGSIGTITGVGEQADTEVTLNIDVSRGDLIRIKATRTVGTGELSEPITKLFLKWRLV